MYWNFSHPESVAYLFLSLCVRYVFVSVGRVALTVYFERIHFAIRYLQKLCISLSTKILFFFFKVELLSAAEFLNCMSVKMEYNSERPLLNEQHVLTAGYQNNFMLNINSVP